MRSSAWILDRCTGPSTTYDKLCTQAFLGRHCPCKNLWRTGRKSRQRSLYHIDKIRCLSLSRYLCIFLDLSRAGRSLRPWSISRTWLRNGLEDSKPSTYQCTTKFSSLAFQHLTSTILLNDLPIRDDYRDTRKVRAPKL